MPTHHETRLLPYTPEQLYALVIDIEHYPEFLPWCRGARVISRDADGFLGELIIHFAALTERYTSRVTPRVPPPIGGRLGGGPSGQSVGNEVIAGGAPLPTSPLLGEGQYVIDVALVSGPFHHLTNHWVFTPKPGGCEITLDLDFKFKSKILDGLIGGLFGKACAKMVAAFTTRAEALYGKK